MLNLSVTGGSNSTGGGTQPIGVDIDTGPFNKFSCNYINAEENSSNIWNGGGCVVRLQNKGADVIGHVINRNLTVDAIVRFENSPGNARVGTLDNGGTVNGSLVDVQDQLDGTDVGWYWGPTGQVANNSAVSDGSTNLQCLAGAGSTA
jgi:hypothetical protein